MCALSQIDNGVYLLRPHLTCKLMPRAGVTCYLPVMLNQQVCGVCVCGVRVCVRVCVVRCAITMQAIRHPMQVPALATIADVKQTLQSLQPCLVTIRSLLG